MQLFYLQNSNPEYTKYIQQSFSLFSDFPWTYVSERSAWFLGRTEAFPRQSHSVSQPGKNSQRRPTDTEWVQVLFKRQTLNWICRQMYKNPTKYLQTSIINKCACKLFYKLEIQFLVCSKNITYFCSLVFYLSLSNVSLSIFIICCMLILTGFNV